MQPASRPSSSPGANWLVSGGVAGRVELERNDRRHTLHFLNSKCHLVYTGCGGGGRRGGVGRGLEGKGRERGRRDDDCPKTGLDLVPDAADALARSQLLHCLLAHAHVWPALISRNGRSGWRRAKMKVETFSPFYVRTFLLCTITPEISWRYDGSRTESERETVRQRRLG